ncbi:MAG TPA: acyl-ACP thioesterase domain-containing protein [Rectinemataceae bacterium]|nr:acyl-ACP thioesterase domain-containing protein [Rectinemataceae bacterium]
MSEQAAPYGGRADATAAETGPNPPSLSLEYVIRGFECGYGGPLKALPLMNLLQEAAGAHADLLGWGVDDLMAAGRTWMLSRLDLRVARLPRTGERVSVSTWPAGAERLFALRDFVMRGPGGEPLVSAVYAYLIVDLAARRPLRPERVFGPGFLRGAEAHPVADFTFAVPEAGAVEESYALRACPRHLDNNGHVNNAYIVDWLTDAVPMPARASGALRALRVEFDAEALAGDDLRALWGRAAPGPGAPGAQLVTELRRGEDLVARARTEWS